jgi:glycosyltransferase involved in cell wall biosynthesis
MRIAYIAVKGMPIGGGIEKLTEEIGSRLVRKGHHVVVYSSRDYGTSDGEFKGMEIRTVSSLNTRSFHKLSICFHAICKVINGADADLVHIHAVGPSIFSIFPRLKGIPTVVQMHGFEWKRDKWGIIAKSFFKLADCTAIYFPHKTTSVSKVQKGYYEKKFGREIAYIPTGVNEVTKRKPRWILNQGLEPSRYILFAARLVEEKGAHYLIEAFRSIQTAMSYGNCCVASDIPENLEALEHNGYTFENRNPKSLSRVLTSLIEHPEKVEEKKARARRHVLQFYSWDKIADKMEALYISLLDM